MYRPSDESCFLFLVERKGDSFHSRAADKAEAHTCVRGLEESGGTGGGGACPRSRTNAPKECRGFGAWAHTMCRRYRSQPVLTGLSFTLFAIICCYKSGNVGIYIEFFVLWFSLFFESSPSFVSLRLGCRREYSRKVYHHVFSFPSPSFLDVSPLLGWIVVCVFRVPFSARG